MKLHILAPAVVLALASAAPSAARAQAQPGDMARASAGPEGIVVATTRDSLRLAIADGDAAAPAWTVVRLDVGGGGRSTRESTAHGLVRGLAYGAAVGAVTGFLLGDSFCQVEPTLAPGSSASSESRGCGFGGRMIGAGLGAVGGGAIGMALQVTLHF